MRRRTPEDLWRIDRFLREFYRDEPIAFELAVFALGTALFFFVWWLWDLVKTKGW